MGEIFKSLIWDALVSTGLKALFSALPILGWGPFGLVITIVVHWFADYLYKSVDEFIDLNVIAFRKKELAVEYAKQSVNLKRIAQTNGTNSTEFKDAFQTAKYALRDHIHFNG